MRLDDVAGSASPLTDEERGLLDPAMIDAGLRLACQTRVSGDLLVAVPEESRTSSKVTAKQIRQRTREVAPAVKISPFTSKESQSLEELELTATASHALDRLRGGSVTDLAAVVWQDSLILDVHPATDTPPLLGLAVDIGTTTIAVYLTDLSNGEILASQSALNPQVAYGDDIITRLQYAAHHDGGAEELQTRAATEIDRLAAETATLCGASTRDIHDVVIVGNTAIHHLFMGLSTDSLRQAPFEPAVRNAIDTTAASLGLNLHPECRLYALPIEAGFVGADNVAVIVAEEPYRQEELTLLIDVGTNGELVLGDSKRMLSASCATGPAFEGAHIEHGTRAVPGAIERVRIDPATLEVDFKMVGTDQWSGDLPPGEVQARGICGSGVIEAASEMFRCGIVLPDGAFAPDLQDERILMVDGRPRKLVIARAEESATGRPVTVSLKDIRALQLGKAALRAGAEILLKLYGAQRPDRVVLAGAFGSYIDRRAALTIGMLPSCDPDKVTSVGNAAGDGALLSLLSLDKRREAEWAAEAVEYVELASITDFQQYYMEAMRFEPSVEGLL